MLLHRHLMSLLIVVCARAQLQQQQQQQQHHHQQQQPLHAQWDQSGPGSKTPSLRPQRSMSGGNGVDGSTHVSQGGFQREDQDGHQHGGQNRVLLAGQVPDIPALISNDRASSSSSSSASGQATGELSEKSRSDRSRRSSVRNVLTATSLEKRGHGAVDSTSQHEASTSPDLRLHSRLFSSALSGNADYYFVESEQEEEEEKKTKTAGRVSNTAGQIMLSPAVVPLVAENWDRSSPTRNLSRDLESVTLSSVLKDAFEERNPTMLPGYFAEGVGHRSDGSSLNRGLDSDIPHHHHHHHHLSSQAAQQNVLMKRDKASMPRNDNSDANDDDTNIDDDAAASAAKNDTILPSVPEKRSSWRCSTPDVLVGDGDLPWTCHQRWAWRYLGEHVYPSRVYEAVCEGRSCWYGHFNCTPITYTLHALEFCLHSCLDHRVPYPLRSLWQWTDLNVTVGCQCVR